MALALFASVFFVASDGFAGCQISRSGDAFCPQNSRPAKIEMNFVDPVPPKSTVRAPTPVGARMQFELKLQEREFSSVTLDGLSDKDVKKVQSFLEEQGRAATQR